MKKGISWFSIPGELSTKEKFQLVKSAGYDGVELQTVRSETELFEFKEKADEAGLETPSFIETVHWKAPLSAGNVEKRSNTRKIFKSNLEYAAKIGSNTVLCVPGVVSHDSSYPNVYKTALNEIKILAKVAEEVKVNLAIENVWNKFLLSPLEFIDFLDQVNSPYVKAYFDCGNICLYGYPQDWIRLLGKKRIAKIHVKGFLDYPHEIGFPKSLISDVPWKSIMQAIHEIDYDDYLIVEIKADGNNDVEKVFQYSKELSRIIEGAI
jgi:L-ribulose-5-phosphate 3-epimerase